MGTVQDDCVDRTNHAVEMVCQLRGGETVEFTSQRDGRPLGLDSRQNGEFPARIWPTPRRVSTDCENEILNLAPR